MATAATLLEAALSLSEDERAELALRLVESLESGPDEDVEAVWADEVEHGIEALQAGRAETVPLDRAMAEARARLRNRHG